MDEFAEMERGQLEHDARNMKANLSVARQKMAAYSEIGVLAGMPMWARVALVLGIPNMVLAFLLGQSAGVVPSIERAIYEQLQRRYEQFDQHVRDTRDLAVAVRTAAKIMCENAARTDEQRRHCTNIQ